MCDDVTYLAELMNDRNELSLCHGRFKHVERLVDQEIVNVRSLLFDATMTEFDLPPPIGEPRMHKDRVFIPDFGRKQFNFVGRLLGPRGKTLKRIEQDTGCKLMIRGEGSQRQPNFGVYGARWESSMSSFYPHSPTTTVSSGGNFCFSPPAHLQASPQHMQSAPATFNPLLPPPPSSASLSGPGPIGSPTHTFGSTLSPTHSTSSSTFFHFSPPQKTAASAVHTQPNASAGFNPFMMHRAKPKLEEGANEPLHVLIQCEDTPNRAFVRLSVAKNLILKLFQPVDDAHDELKHKQLLELSLMNGTFKAVPQLQTPRKQWPPTSF